jgi:hypothetical protein
VDGGVGVLAGWDQFPLFPAFSPAATTSTPLEHLQQFDNFDLTNFMICQVAKVFAK